MGYLQIQNYSLEMDNMFEHVQVARVMIYIKNNVVYKRLREKEMNSQKCRELAALQLKLSYYLGKLKSSVLQEESIFWMARFESAKENLNAFYKARAKIILHQNRAE